MQEACEKLKDKINFKFAVIITTIFLFFIGTMISFIPDILDASYIRENFLPSILDFQAEKSELIQYVTLTISFPILFMITYSIIKKTQYAKKNNLEKINKIINIISIIFVIALIIAIACNKQFISIQNFSLFKYNPVLMLFIYIFLLPIMFLYTKKKSKKLDYIIYSLLGFTIVFIAYLFISPKFELNRYMRYHFDAYYYPIIKTLSGLTIGIDFNCLYGNYAYVFSAILSIFPSESYIFVFSCLTAGLVLLYLTNYTIFLNKIVKNKFLLLIGMLVIIYFAIIRNILINQSNYLQYVPHRVVMISILLVYVLFYLKYRETKNKYLLEMIGYLISTIAMVWNMETGLIALGVWYLFLCYENLYFNSLKEKKTYIELLRHTLMAIIAVVFYISIIEVIALARTGTMIGIKDALFGQALFLKYGYYMIKMELFAPWVFLVLIYGACIAYSLKNLRFLNKYNDSKKFQKNIILFTLSVLGVGIFYYYEGRSHWEVLSAVVYPAIMLTIILIDSFLGSNDIKQHKARILFVIMTLLLFICFGATTVYSLFCMDELKPFINKEALNEKSVVDDSIEQIKKIEKNIGNIDILDDNESIIYSTLSKKDTKRINGYVDIFTYDDVSKILNFLNEEDKPLLINKNLFIKMKEKYKSNLEEITNNKYIIYEINTDILIVPTRLRAKANNISGIKIFK